MAVCLLNSSTFVRLALCHTPTKLLLLYAACRHPRAGRGPLHPRPDGVYKHYAAEQKALPAPANTASNQPAYDKDYYPECEGKCASGLCALRWDHPKCCYVPPEGSAYYGSYTAAQSHGASSGPKVTPERSGYWQTHYLFCWE